LETYKITIVLKFFYAHTFLTFTDNFACAFTGLFLLLLTWRPPTQTMFGKVFGFKAGFCCPKEITAATNFLNRSE
jgi:hypothetical protein